MRLMECLAAQIIREPFEWVDAIRLAGAEQTIKHYCMLNKMVLVGCFPTFRSVVSQCQQYVTLAQHAPCAG